MSLSQVHSKAGDPNWQQTAPQAGIQGHALPPLPPTCGIWDAGLSCQWAERKYGRGSPGGGSMWQAKRQPIPLAGTQSSGHPDGQADNHGPRKVETGGWWHASSAPGTPHAALSAAAARCLFFTEVIRWEVERERVMQTSYFHQRTSPKLPCLFTPSFNCSTMLRVEAGTEIFPASPAQEAR